MSSIGQTWTLEVLRFASPGAFLDARHLGEVLLPNKYCSENIAVELGGHLLYPPHLKYRWQKSANLPT